MKNKNILVTLGIIISWIFIYLGFAFVLIEINPFEWKQSSREGYIAIMFCISICLCPLYIPINKLN